MVLVDWQVGAGGGAGCFHKTNLPLPFAFGEGRASGITDKGSLVSCLGISGATGISGGSGGSGAIKAGGAIGVDGVWSIIESGMSIMVVGELDLILHSTVIDLHVGQ